MFLILRTFLGHNYFCTTLVNLQYCSSTKFSLFDCARFFWKIISWKILDVLLQNLVQRIHSVSRHAFVVTSCYLVTLNSVSVENT